MKQQDRHHEAATKSNTDLMAIFVDYPAVVSLAPIGIRPIRQQILPPYNK